MNNPLVTVITPTYNCGKYLRATMDSVLSQSYHNIEYIVIDDGSTDNTQAILATYNDKRLTVITQENMGEHKAVNEGLKRVEGKYFMYPNADDPLEPNAIETLVETMEANPGVLCAYPDWYVINEDGGTVNKVTTREFDFAWMVRHHTCIPSVGSMFRSSVIQTVGLRDPQFRWVSDFDYWLRIGLAGPMMRVPYTLACWRKHGAQASGVKSDARAADHVAVIDEFFWLVQGQVGSDNPRFYNARVFIPHARWCIFEWFNRFQGIFLIDPEYEAMCWAHLVAGSISGSKMTALKHFMRALRWYPKVLASFQTYHIIYKRLIHAWRKG